jgi:hypothetical protein
MKEPKEEKFDHGSLVTIDFGILVLLMEHILTCCYYIGVYCCNTLAFDCLCMCIMFCFLNFMRYEEICWELSLSVIQNLFSFEETCSCNVSE